MIYTKTGDKGDTSLANGQRVPKTDARIEAYGTVDELSSFVGWLRTGMPDEEKMHAVQTQLEWIQNRLFNLGAALSEAPGEWIEAQDVVQIEQWIDAMQAVVPKQHAFILPYGMECVCRCHVCRAVCRRAERRMIEMDAISVHRQFINRLSDYFFVLSRFLTFLLNGTEFAWKKDFHVEKLTE